MIELFLAGGLALTAFALAVLIRADWHFLIQPIRQTDALVQRHGSRREEGTISYTAILSFTDEAGGAHQVNDIVQTASPSPPVGAAIGIIYPRGRPELARVRRPLLRLLVYAALLVMAGLLIARWAGVIS